MKEKIIKKFSELGFGQVSFIPVQPLPLWEKAMERCKALDINSIDYWEARDLVSDCKAILKDAKTIIAAVHPYQPHENNLSYEHGFYSTHYEVYPKGRKAAASIGKLLTDKGYDVEIDPPVPAKQIAYLGGLGKFGKNSLILHDKFGSFFTLHILLTNAKIEPDYVELGEISDCGKCRLCIHACPMQAISGDGIIVTSRCLRYYMLRSDIIPVHVRKKIGNRMVGCDDCQLVCPRNRVVIQQADKSEIFENIFDIKKLLIDAGTGVKKHMLNISERIGSNYARAQRVISMAVIVAGNSRDASYIPLLAKTLQHPHPPIRAHSAWAIGRLEGEGAKELLEGAQSWEKNLEVQRDISLALQSFTKKD